MCDAAYVVLLEQVERRTLADRQGLIARGGEIPELPQLHIEQQRLDDALAEEPKPAPRVDVEQMELRRALGVA